MVAQKVHHLLGKLRLCGHIYIRHPMSRGASEAAALREALASALRLLEEVAAPRVEDSSEGGGAAPAPADLLAFVAAARPSLAAPRLDVDVRGCREAFAGACVCAGAHFFVGGSGVRYCAEVCGSGRCSADNS